MDEKAKLALFEHMLWMEKKAEQPNYSGRDFFEQANGAFEMLVVLGLGREYIRWSEGK